MMSRISPLKVVFACWKLGFIGGSCEGVLNFKTLKHVVYDHGLLDENPDGQIHETMLRDCLLFAGNWNYSI